MEIVESAGLRIMLDSISVRAGERWTSTLAPGLWVGTLLEGQLAVQHERPGEQIWQRGNAAAFKAEQPIRSDHCSLSDGTLSAIFIQVDRDRMEQMLGADVVETFLPADGADLINVPSAVSTIAWQMFGCPMKGSARRLYLTGKALEMIAHLLPEEDAATQQRSTRWAPRDIECFHAARAILLAELANPPSVPELARRVGTNTRKLSAGFAELFGSPVYAFVKARRLDEARLLLEAGESTVSRVAQAFGYQPTHFATEFRRRFGLSPGEIAGKRRIL